MKAKVWRKNPNAKVPERATNLSVGYDVCASEDVEIPEGGFALIPTGLVIQAPESYAIFVFPRSSLFKKKGLIMPNSAGIIDFDYCGEEDEIKIPVVNLKKEKVVVKKGEKVAQIVFIKVGFPEIEEVEEAPGKNSRGGFGSTGGYHVAK